MTHKLDQNASRDMNQSTKRLCIEGGNTLHWFYEDAPVRGLQYAVGGCEHMRNLSFLIFYMRGLGYELYGSARGGTCVWQTFVRPAPLSPIKSSEIES